MNLEIIPQAQDEIAEAARYYHLQRSGLGDEFLAAMRDAVATVAANPLLFEEARAGIRRCLLERFPYGIYYRTPDPDTIRIILVRHHSRHPGFGMRRK